MRVLIAGARGQVGHELMRLVPEGFEAVGMSSSELDVADAVQVAAVVEDVQPQLIINAAAYTAVDKAESESERAWAGEPRWCGSPGACGREAGDSAAAYLHRPVPGMSLLRRFFRQAHELGLLERIPHVRGIDRADYPTLARRPAWSVLDCSKLQQAHGITPAGWHDELCMVLRELAQG